MNRNALRRLMRDPPPLPADASPWLDEQSKDFYEEAVDLSAHTMRLHDKSPPELRLVNTIVGNIDISRQIFRQGPKTIPEIEAEVRHLLSSQQKEVPNA